MSITEPLALHIVVWQASAEQLPAERQRNAEEAGASEGRGQGLSTQALDAIETIREDRSPARGIGDGPRCSAACFRDVAQATREPGSPGSGKHLRPDTVGVRV